MRSTSSDSKCFQLLLLVIVILVNVKAQGDYSSRPGCNAGNGLCFHISTREECEAKCSANILCNMYEWSIVIYNNDKCCVENCDTSTCPNWDPVCNGWMSYSKIKSGDRSLYMVLGCTFPSILNSSEISSNENKIQRSISNSTGLRLTQVFVALTLKRASVPIYDAEITYWGINDSTANSLLNQNSSIVANEIQTQTNADSITVEQEPATAAATSVVVGTAAKKKNISYLFLLWIFLALLFCSCICCCVILLPRLQSQKKYKTKPTKVVARTKTRKFEIGENVLAKSKDSEYKSAVIQQRTSVGYGVVFSNSTAVIKVKTTSVKKRFIEGDVVHVRSLDGTGWKPATVYDVDHPEWDYGITFANEGQLYVMSKKVISPQEYQDIQSGSKVLYLG